MAQTPIRLDDEVYTEIKKRADMQGRSYANLVNYYLRKEFGWLPGQVHGEPLSNITPEKNNSEPDGSGVNVGDLFSADTAKKLEAERPQDPELLCCKNDNKPCKHWVWDAQTGEGYRNVLSGRYKEAS